MRRRGRVRVLEQVFERRVKAGDRERKPGGERDTREGMYMPPDL